MLVHHHFHAQLIETCLRIVVVREMVLAFLFELCIRHINSVKFFVNFVHPALAFFLLLRQFVCFFVRFFEAFVLHLVPCLQVFVLFPGFFQREIELVIILGRFFLQIG